VTVYARSQIGKRVCIHAGVVIGSDGFGYVFDSGFQRKIPQIGNVIIGDDVEIGSNTCIDRAALGSTIIGKGTKIDNLVHVGHNVEIGEHSILCAQVGIAGSAKLGNYCVLAGQVGIAGHIVLGNRVTVGSKSGVMNSIPDGEPAGYPGAARTPDQAGIPGPAPSSRPVEKSRGVGEDARRRIAFFEARGGGERFVSAKPPARRSPASWDNSRSGQIEPRRVTESSCAPDASRHRIILAFAAAVRNLCVSTA